MDSTQSRIVKLKPQKGDKAAGITRYLVVWGKKKGPPKGRARKGTTGRKRGRRYPTPKEDQIAGESYCFKCDRKLNANNKSGKCRVCSWSR